jgi:hypothetical protein
LKHRFGIVNVWRPVRGPVLDSPLALCDAQTFADDDLIAIDLVYLTSGRSPSSNGNVAIANGNARNDDGAMPAPRAASAAPECLKRLRRLIMVSPFLCFDIFSSGPRPARPWKRPAPS